MISKCHFCMKNEISEEVEGVSIMTSEPINFLLCKRCAYEKRVCDDRKGRPEKFQHYDVGKLCIGCGVCCFILHARVTEEEATKIVAENGIEKSDFVHKTELGQALYPDDLTIKTPCMFLLGHPLQGWTACKIHEKTRPMVCKTYLCKIAIQYKVGAISLGEAKYWMRASILSRDLSIFNWTRDDSESKILISSMISDRVDHLRSLGRTEDEIKMSLAAMVTPRYGFKSEPDRVIFEMHLATHDRGDDDPAVFFTDDELFELEKELRSQDRSTDKTLRYIINRVMSTIRRYFDCDERSPFVPVGNVDENKAAELREMELKGEE